MLVVLDTCILKLATFQGEDNPSALIFELARRNLIEAWASPAILEEYADVLGDRPDFVAEVVEMCRVCYPLTELRVIRHEPDNRFLECALAASADFILTVNIRWSRMLLPLPSYPRRASRGAKRRDMPTNVRGENARRLWGSARLSAVRLST